MYPFIKSFKQEKQIIFFNNLWKVTLKSLKNLNAV